MLVFAICSEGEDVDVAAGERERVVVEEVDGIGEREKERRVAHVEGDSP